MRGKFTPVTYSEERFKKKIDTLRKREKEQDFEYGLDKRFIFPRRDMNRVIRRLKRDSLEDTFYYDKPKEDLRGSVPVRTPNVGIASIRTPEIKTPPLPPQPTPVAPQPVAQVIPQTGLTASETALLSPDEQAIRLKQRGIA